MNLYGSICVSDIPKELFKKADNGKVYLSLRIYERKEVGKYGDTHFISCAPKKEEQKDGVNYICGNLKTSNLKTSNLKTSNPQPYNPTPEQVSSMPAAAPDDLPF